MKPPFPSLWDSSMIATLRSCPQKFFLEYVQHWKSKQPSVHLHAGAAFAKGLEAAREAFYIQGHSPAGSINVGLHELLKAYGDFEAPADSAKTAIRMAGALEFYFSTWPLGQDPAVPARIGEKLGIEFSFAQPLPIKHPETGEPLMFCGRADQVCDFSGGRWIEDDKTTTELGPKWTKQWDLRSQFTGYTWAAREANMRVDGVLVRGVAILKTMYNRAETVTYRPEWQVKRWLEQVTRDIKHAIEAWHEGYWNYNLDHGCNEYGGCSFRQICLIQDPQPFLDLNYEQRVWNPLLRTETKVIEMEAA